MDSAENPGTWPQDAALWFLKNNKVWTNWVPADVAEKVNDALADS